MYKVIWTEGKKAAVIDRLSKDFIKSLEHFWD